MPQDVELRLIADNKDAVKGVRELAQESQKLYDNNKKAQQREVGLIADIEKELDRMKEKKRNAFTIESIEKYNKKIKEAELALKEYNEAGVKTEKQTESMSQMITKWALGLGGSTAALKLLKDALLATTQGINAFNLVTAASKQLLSNIVNGVDDWTAGLANAIAVQKQLNDLRLKEVIDTYKAKEQQVLYNKYYFEASDRRKTDTETILLLNKAMEAHNKMIEIQKDNILEQLAATEQLLKSQPANEKLLMQYAGLQTELLDLESERYSGTKRLESSRTSMMQEEIDKRKAMMERYFAEIDKMNEDADKKEQKRIDDVNKYDDFVTQLGKKKRDEKEKQGVAEMDRLAKQYQANKELSEKDFEDQIAIAIIKDNALKAEAQRAWDQMQEDERKLQEFEEYKTEQRKANLERYIESAKQFIEVLGWIADKQLEESERDRELLDTKISEKQRSIETEAELQKAGFANNLNLRQQELTALQKQRDIALTQEENARKKQRQIQIATMMADKASALADVIINTRVANAKAIAVSPLTAGMPWVAINNIAAAVSIAAIIAAVTQAVTAKYAKGGWTGDGSRRDETGERVAGVVHEREFVIRKGPAHRFRPMLEAINKDNNRMIIQEFNKISPELQGATVNNVVVENEGPNRRLDEVNSQLRRLNSRSEINQQGNKTVIRRGNNTRIIKK